MVPTLQGRITPGHSHRSGEGGRYEKLSSPWTGADEARSRGVSNTFPESDSSSSGSSMGSWIGDDEGRDCVRKHGGVWVGSGATECLSSHSAIFGTVDSRVCVIILPQKDRGDRWGNDDGVVNELVDAPVDPGGIGHGNDGVSDSLGMGKRSGGQIAVEVESGGCRTIEQVQEAREDSSISGSFVRAILTDAIIHSASRARTKKRYTPMDDASVKKRDRKNDQSAASNVA
ncbi:hypothetical protein DFH07DRAFT_765345 [Mycena maculata]|uniref:Uncharacterized protein n=1 Tax=Mycena maculata TaxID=230809 RepID=A0AAD7NYW9_9AGAR|nr:hypothetical protein DFH07DRAFT_765345 [Mycena maculata]